MLEDVGQFELLSRKELVVEGPTAATCESLEFLYTLFVINWVVLNAPAPVRGDDVFNVFAKPAVATGAAENRVGDEFNRMRFSGPARIGLDII